MTEVEIIPVSGLAQSLTFSKLPRYLYEGAKGFVPPLDVERWSHYSHRFNPHFKLVEGQEFLARSDGRWVGRIAAQV